MIVVITTPEWEESLSSCVLLGGGGAPDVPAKGAGARSDVGSGLGAVAQRAPRGAIRRLKRRDQPRAAEAPRTGRGPGTGANAA